MNCELVQRHLLTSEKPEQPSPEVRRHLAECPSCRVWLRQLTQLEQQLPLLATPPSQRKAEVVRLILHAPEPVALNGTGPDYLRRWPFVTPARDRGLLKASVAIAMAAALMVFALGAWLWQHQLTTLPGADPLASHRAERDRRLREAPTTRAKVETLAELMDDVHQQALAARNDADQLAQLAKFYVELVRVDLPAQAKGLTADLRGDVLDGIVQRLTEMESELARMASDSGVKPANQSALHEMALAAKASHEQLLKIQRG
jgi:hypothetical protein